MYKVKNITDDPRQFREHKSAEAHFLRAGEEIIVNNLPATDRVDVFEITDLSKIQIPEEKEKVPEEKRDIGERRLIKKKK